MHSTVCDILMKETTICVIMISFCETSNNLLIKLETICIFKKCVKGKNMEVDKSSM